MALKSMHVRGSLRVYITYRYSISKINSVLTALRYQKIYGMKLKIQGIVWETAGNEIKRDSSEMNPGWPLAPVNQITTKGSRAWWNLSAGSYSPETQPEKSKHC